DVGEELHFNGDGAIALAGFAASAGNVEGKISGGVAAALDVGSIGENIANGVKSFQVRRGIGAGGTADGRLIHDDEILNVLVAIEPIAEFLDGGAAAFGLKRFIEDVVNERGLARAADARDDCQNAERKHEVHILEVVERCATQA